MEEVSGNVWEWTRSLWGEDWRRLAYGYPYDPGDGREDLQAPEEMRRVLRGGSYWTASQSARCACHWDVARLAHYDAGFRLVLSSLP